METNETQHGGERLAAPAGSAFPRFSIFPNGTSHMIWLVRNCDRCIKNYDPEKHANGRSECDIENAISLASATDGSLLHDGITPPNKADAIARRLNWDGQSYLEHDCPEFVP